eukprot:Gb_39938 [translate_table: standard]
MATNINSEETKKRPLDGQAAIVTGASRGIGREIAFKLAQNGAKVLVNYLGNSEKAEEVASQINKTEGDQRAITFKADISDSSQVKQMFDKASECFGQIHIVVNNAAVGNVDEKYPAITDLSEEDWERTFSVNTKGTFLCCKEAAKRLVHGGGGRIINITSSVVLTLRPGYGAYAASKAAVETMTKILARELRGTRITANCVAPGPVATDMFFAGKDEATAEAIGKANPMERLGRTEDISPFVAFLASDEGEWINAQVIRLNGGMI